jgi:8-hydroxy-5-deazaflavin:NADPH oxidoreductase
MKKLGVLGTGMVGTTIANKLLELGYEVMMGSRTASNDKQKAWILNKGDKAHIGTFDQAAAFGELLFYCVKGDTAVQIAKSLTPSNIKGKTIIDISNPLDFSKGMPPFLAPALTNTNSLGEELQKVMSEAHLVKSLNIVSSTIMVSEYKPGDSPTMFISGNNADAKQETMHLLKAFGWKDIIDLGDITTARGTEMLLPLWVRTMQTLGHPNFAFTVSR